MQTFLPYPSYVRSAQCLDNKRLGKQRVECLQIARTLVGISSGWRNHPAVKMWSGHTDGLIIYGLVICREWVNREFKDTCYGKLMELVDGKILDGMDVPSWFGDPDFHRSHQSNLLRKDPEWYGKFDWNVPNDLPYVWPAVSGEQR